MKQLSYTVRFTTPAFLGNAEQSAQWRTPPFKALLRQWWRVVYAADKNFKVTLADMRREEGLLFGHAWLDDDAFERDGRHIAAAARKSEIRIRLNMPTNLSGHAWGHGTQQGVAPLPTGLDTGYAWFGLIKRGTSQPDRNAIRTEEPESTRELMLAIPDQHASRVETAMRLIAHFGQLGSRCRGGWGSFFVRGIQDLPRAELAKFAQSLKDCLRYDWPMSFCSDARGDLCLWESEKTFQTWDKAMGVVATERRNARIALKSLDGRDFRPVLGFASPGGRMPSPLRWRIEPASNGELSIRVFAMPSLIPEEGKQRFSTQEIETAWNKVIAVLDGSKAFKPRGVQA